MSSANSLPYHLRPNKAADRELFILLLNYLNANFDLKKYKYIGLGGPFMEDFRIIHNRIGISDMDSIESDENTFKRQCFNKPVNTMNCIHDDLDIYLSKTEFDSSVIIWFDYTDPGFIIEQIESFVRHTLTLPIYSILRITLNANPESLGRPEKGEKEDLLEWRLSRFKSKFGDKAPVDVSKNDIRHKNYGKVILRALDMAIDKANLSMMDREALWAFSTFYSDGQPMVTGSLIILPKIESNKKKIITTWEYYCDLKSPHVLDLPVLSTYERIILERKTGGNLDYTIPENRLGEDPYSTFNRYYRVYPHYVRVEV
jgi:hypothetical protein